MTELKELYLKYCKEVHGVDHEPSLSAMLDKPHNFFEMFLLDLLAKKNAEIDEHKRALKRQGDVALAALQDAHKASRLELSIAQDIRASLNPDLLDSERQMNEILTNENLRLESTLEQIRTYISANTLQSDHLAASTQVICLDGLNKLIKP